ncbi:MAG TPA: hypothetical protein VEC01_03970 [Noviherbaspirillum sp.]|uniref:hypothetical protein n=1 Tax=Noviherbaspirillum sp. TaxID=1926288 RepID=UPI002D47FDF8|nr:hypothetical protein [Noviherbaspirillum sp.]HYD94458.1 hypothetical protein [Noviherbaspirillum sp.]
MNLNKHVASLAAALALTAAAPAQASGVYIAGHGTSFDQALGQALKDNSARSADAFWIVIAGDQVAQVTRKGASADTRAGLKSALERGAEVYACRSDLTRAGIRDDELLDGVVAMYGYSERDWAGLLPPKKDGIALPGDMAQSQRILKTCAGEAKPGA